MVEKTSQLSMFKHSFLYIYFFLFSKELNVTTKTDIYEFLLNQVEKAMNSGINHLEYYIRICITVKTLNMGYSFGEKKNIK